MNPEIPVFKRSLQKSGYSVTGPRMELFRILQNHSTLSVRQLISQLPNQNPATVYRNIKVFEDLLIVNKLQLGWNSKLELSDKFHRHHHHLTCIMCGQVILVEENHTLETEIAHISKTNKFKPIDHQLEIRGVCTKCQCLKT